MKRFLILMIVLTFLSACSRSIHPNQIVETEFDLTEAQMILEKTWEPVKTMTDSKLVTKPRVDLSSREDFFNEYKFLYMDDLVKKNIYESLVITDKSGKEVKDSKGNLVFEKGDFGIFIPTIYDEGVFIERAYLKETKYKEENSDLDKIELIIEEKSNDSINRYATGFYRTNIFRKNENNEWVLMEALGPLSYSWERGKE